MRMRLAGSRKVTAATPTTHTEYCGDSTLLVTMLTSSATRATSAGPRVSRRPSSRSTPRRASTARPARVMASPRGIVTGTSTSIAPKRNCVGTSVKTFHTMKGSAPTDSTCSPRAPCSPRKDTPPVDHSITPPRIAADITTKPRMPRGSERRGRAMSIRPGHTLSSVPAAAAAPLHTGRATSTRATTAARVGTTSKRASHTGPTSTAPITQAHAASRPTPRRRPAMARTASVARSQSRAMRANATTGLDPSRAARAKTRPAPGGYCHMSSPMGKRPVTSRLDHSA